MSRPDHTIRPSEAGKPRQTDFRMTKPEAATPAQEEPKPAAQEETTTKDEVKAEPVTPKPEEPPAKADEAKKKAKN